MKGLDIESSQGSQTYFKRDYLETVASWIYDILMQVMYLDPLGIPQPGCVRGEKVADRDVAAVGGALHVLPAPAVAVLRGGF